ncbi:hypothetical protein ALC62_15182, partial [Cyphomyrmex costatus]
AIGGDFVPKKNDLICSTHFVHTDFLERPGASNVRLKNFAVPSVFLEAPTSDTCDCQLMSHIRTNHTQDTHIRTTTHAPSPTSCSHHGRNRRSGRLQSFRQFLTKLAI